jgi:hypothetical protein
MKQQDDHLAYLNVLFKLVSEVDTIEIDKISIDTLSISYPEKLEFQSLIRKIKIYQNLMDRFNKQKGLSKDDSDEMDKLRNVFNNLNLILYNPLTEIKDKESRISYLTEQYLDK